MADSNRDIIVVGASAGGVEALKQFVAGLPPDLPAAVFIVLHLWPGGKSFLPAILERAGPLPVIRPQNGDPFERGKIYVAPVDLHLFLREDRLAVLYGPRENRSRPAINPLFRSAAAVYGPRVIGVILTGTMDDGAAGLWAVKQCGGLAVVQDPADAAFDEMPRSAIEAVEVDYCVPLSEVSALVTRLSREHVEWTAPVAVPEVIRFGNEEAQMKQTDLAIDNIGQRSVFTCPECNGALWELKEGGQLSFRCHVGHAFTPRSLKEEQVGVLEHSLWSALRALVESAAMDERLAQRAAEHSLEASARAHRQNAADKRNQEKYIREFLAGLRPLESDGNSAEELDNNSRSRPKE
jgi:two-component system chemotaxis response regulator CheB